VYCRTFIIFSGFLAFHVQPNWDENDFDIKVIAKNLNTNGEANAHYASNTTNLGISLNTVNLFNGWGFSASHSSSYASANNETNTNYHNRNSNLRLKLFVKDNVDMDVNLSQQALLNSNGIVSTNFLNQQTKTYFIQKSNSVLFNLNIGNDQDHWNIKVSTDISDYTNDDITTRVTFREYNKHLTDISTSWKVSEDSFLTAKYGSQDNNSLQSDTSYKTSIINSYLGFKTRYLGSSQISLDLGSSSVNGSNNSISWKLTHKTNINDYFTAIFSNGRRFIVANDFRFNADLNTYNNLSITFVPSSYYSVNLSADLKDGLISESVHTKTTLFNTGIKFNYLTHWNSIAFVQKLEYEDTRGLFDYQQTQIGFQISRDLI
jgi:hypothetical protein